MNQVRAREPQRRLVPWMGLLAMAMAFGAMGLRGAEAAGWPVERQWTQQEEQNFSQWFARLASRQWSSVNRMLHSKKLNSLYDPQDDRLYFYADCGDFPYVIRAYYAYKRRLPFVANYVSGGRYARTGNKTSSTFDNLSHPGTPADYFRRLTNVHTGNFRTAPDATDSFTYPIAIDPSVLAPGKIFYSPNGHIAMVAEVLENGSIMLIDAHPDQSVTRIRFGPKLEVRSRTASGGFRAFRKTIVRGGRAVWVKNNEELPGFSLEQTRFKDYYATVRRRMSHKKLDPLAALESYIRQDTFAEVLDRVESVDRGWAAVQGNGRIAIPSNIYDADGDWENYSTPARDMRMRLSFLNIPRQVNQYIRMLERGEDGIESDGANPGDLGRALLDLKNRLFDELAIAYANSAGEPVRLTLAEIEKRLFRLSFDPNHPPELRWGAEGKELETIRRGKKQSMASYERQQRWRNRIEKKQGPMAPDDADNPAQPPRHDLSVMIKEMIGDLHGRELAVQTAEPAVRSAGGGGF